MTGRRVTTSGSICQSDSGLYCRSLELLTQQGVIYSSAWVSFMCEYSPGVATHHPYHPQYPPQYALPLLHPKPLFKEKRILHLRFHKLSSIFQLFLLCRGEHISYLTMLQFGAICGEIDMQAPWEKSESVISPSCVP